VFTYLVWLFTPPFHLLDFQTFNLMIPPGMINSF
jgi:hypothetical protein